MTTVSTTAQNPEQFQDSGAPPSKRSGVKVVVFLVLLAIAAAVGTWMYYHYRDRVSSDDAQVDGHISAVASRCRSRTTSR